MMNIRENILESFQDIDRDRYIRGKISPKAMLRLVNMLEAYDIMSKCSCDRVSMNESGFFNARLDKLTKEYQFIKEGFENPFVNDNSDTGMQFVQDDMENLSRLGKRSNVNIEDVRLWNRNIDHKIRYDHGKMISGHNFAKGDVIEECPVRMLSNKDLYSRAVRDFAFPIDPNNGIYAIPFGYALFYRDSNAVKCEPNADYEYVDDGNNSYIKIIALCSIPRNKEILIRSTKDDYSNEISPDGFKYPGVGDDYMVVKNFKFA